MLELTYSNRTEALLDRLCARVRAERSAGRGVWEPIHLVAPDPSFKDYLRQGLARELGVAANLRFSYLDGLWKDLLVADDRRLLAFDLLRAGLLNVLGNTALLAEDDLRPVRDYLGHETGYLKRVQLASELAKVFEEYQMSRPDWIDAWRAVRPGDTPDPGLERWQARLWREVVALLDGASDPERPVRHLTLLELIRDSRFEGMAMPRAIHAFGLTHVAQAYQEVFQAFAPLQDTTLHLYALNPCGEFWEDLDTGRNRLWAGHPRREEERRGPWDNVTEDPYGLAEHGPLALRLWGRPGREKIRLLNEVSACDFTSAFEVPEGETLLARMQRDILLFRDPQAAEGAGPDGSIRCLACPSPRREAEVVATEIWRLLELHAKTARPMTFSEIAVVVPPGQQEAYVAHLQAACHDTRQIPLVQGAGSSPLLAQTLEAVELLLDLPTSGFTRAALLRVLLHPAFRRRLGDLKTDAWVRWCEEFGIVRGADRKDWEQTYLTQDALNWDQGLKRLVLGAFLAEGTDFQLGGGTYRVNGAREEGPAAAFIAEVRGLCSEARDLLRPREPRAWTLRLWEYLERWLTVDEGDEAEAVLKVLERIQAYLGRMFERLPQDLTLPELDFVSARHLALEALERLKGEQPANLARGVVVTSYAAMRAIPFRAVFLMGNGEGCFPTRNARNALDLRAKGRRPGDVSQTEKEKYLFLEMLLSAREHLVLSYVALDELSGEAFEPSGLYQEFRELLGQYLAPRWAPVKKRDPFLETHPLRRFDAAYFPQWLGGPAPGLLSCSELAEKEARALWLGGEARRQGVVMPPTVGDLRLDPPAAELLRAALGTPPVPGAGSAKEVIRISLSDLRTFLECPLTGAAAVRLGLRNRPLEDRAAVEDEPFESEFLDSWALQREVALGALGGAAKPGEVYDRCLARLQAEGCAPFGVFSDAERGRNLKVIQGWVGYLAKAAGSSPTSWRLGGDRSGTDTVDHPEPPISFTATVGGQARTVELSGDLRLQLGGSLFLETGQRPSAGGLGKLRKKALAAYLDHHALAIVDPAHGEHAARFVFERPMANGEQEVCLRFRPLARDESLQRLRAWVEDLLNGDHAVLLPIEAVVGAWTRGLTRERILDYLDEQVNGWEVKKFSTLYGPVPDPLQFPPPAEPEAIMERRLQDYLDTVCGERRKEKA